MQDAFDLVDPKFLEGLVIKDEDDNEVIIHLEDDLQEALQRTNVDVFLAELYECILLQITVKQNPNDDVYVDYTHIP